MNRILSKPTRSYEDYLVGWICALPLEMAAAALMLDVEHANLPQDANDHNNYILGEICGHNIVIICLPAGTYGITPATACVIQMRSTFPRIRYALMVGIGGGAPTKVDIRLGDVIVSQPKATCAGVVQYDFGKTISDGQFQRVGVLNKPPPVLLTASSCLQARYLVGKSQICNTIASILERDSEMQATFGSPGPNEDRLFKADYDHVDTESDCGPCDENGIVHRNPRLSNSPHVHYGLIASANQVMKHGRTRDQLANQLGILCFEMEAAGLMDQIPCLVIRGICDYSDSHKNKKWQGYAALAAAAYAKELLSVVSPGQSAPTDAVHCGICDFTPPVISPLAKRHLTNALDMLKTVLTGTDTNDAFEFANLTVQDVKTTALAIEKELAKKQSLRNMRRIMPFLEGLDCYAKMMNALCYGTPYLPWLWAPIKRLLLASSEYVVGLERVIATYSKVAEVLPSMNGLSVNPRSDPDLQRILAMIYADVLDLHREMLCLFHQPNWKLLFATLWRRFDRRLKLIIDNLAENGELLIRNAQTVNITGAITQREKLLEEWKKDEKKRSENEHLAILEWLEVKNWEQEDELDRLHGLQHRDSCHWILSNNKVQSWVRVGSQASTLWLTGKPGAGKSVLSATIVHKLKQDGKTRVLYYFCGYRSHQFSAKHYVLRALMAQLLSGDCNCITYVYDEYVSQGLSPSLYQLKHLLRFLLGVIPSVKIVVDGMDELAEVEQDQLFGEILPISGQKRSGLDCNILISSRDTPYIAARMTKKPTVHLSRERQALDIAIGSLISDEMHAIQTTLDDMDLGNTLLELEKELIEKADGMFLWVRLVLCSLRKAQTLRQLCDTVHLLPKGVENMYEKILQNMFMNATEPMRATIWRILSWVIHGKRPLRKFEIVSGASIHTNNLNPSEEYRLRYGMIENCKPLLEEDRAGTIRLIHFTVREYFVEGSGSRFLPPTQAHFDISFACLACLTKGLNLLDPEISSAQKNNEVARGFHGLCGYAYEYWPFHLENCLKRAGDAVWQSSLLVEQLQEFHHIHGNLLSKEDQPAQSPSGPVNVSHPFLATSPAITEFIDGFVKFRNKIKNQVFHSGKDIDDYKLAHDPTLLTQMTQSYYKIMQNLWSSQDEIPGVTNDQSKRFKQHFSLSVFICRFLGCHSSFDSLTELEDHENSHHTPSIKCTDPSCRFSRIGFRTSNALKAHIQAHHHDTLVIQRPTSIRRRFECEGCSQRFGLEQELLGHKQSQIGTLCGSSETTSHFPQSPQGPQGARFSGSTSGQGNLNGASISPQEGGVSAAPSQVGLPPRLQGPRLGYFTEERREAPATLVAHTNVEPQETPLSARQTVLSQLPPILSSPKEPPRPNSTPLEPAEAPSRPNMPITPEQLAAMTPQQRMQLAQMRRQQGQQRVPISRAAAEEAWNNVPERIRQLYNDIAKNAPAAEPLGLSPEQKATMTQQLRECTDMLGRMDTLAQWFSKIPGQEKNVRSLLAMRIQLMRQFKPGPDWTLNDQFTIAPEYLTGTINYIRRLFQTMIARVKQQQNQPSGQRPSGPQGSTMPQPNQNNMPALNASNLQQLQQQEEALQRARRASSQAASATSAAPQPPFGAPSPQGVPHAYGPGSILPEKLKIPPSKKRK